jgi:hypothetical protein
MKEKKKEFIVIGENGLFAGGIDDPGKVMAMLMFAFFEVWSKEVFPVKDYNKASEVLLNAMSSLKEEESEFNPEDVKRLFNATGLTPAEFFEALECLLSDDDDDDDDHDGFSECDFDITEV